MPVQLRMPNEKQLPPGPRRDFVEEVFRLFRLAHRPPLQAISERILQHEERLGTASRETIRRMLVGKTVPSWHTANTVFIALCGLAGIDPDQDRDLGGYDSPSYQEHFDDLWNRAIDHDPEERPQSPGYGRAAEDPWGSSTPVGASSDDDPPF